MLRILPLLIAVFLGFSPQTRAVTAETPFRIFHVMSYHASWSWNRDQYRGFQDAMGGLPVAYQVLEMDTKRNGAPEHARAMGERAIAAIREWKPDLVYTNDDNAQEYVGRFLAGSPVPVVFSAVNQDPAVYGMAFADNVTGVLEHEHFEATIALLRRLKPGIRRIAVIVDTDPTWRGVVARIRDTAPSIDNLEIVEIATLHTFAEYKQKVRDYQKTVDAFSPLGIFNFTDEKGETVDFEDVLRWTAENSTLPDFAFWDSRVEQGTLCAVSVSGYEQGLIAGRMARRILEGHERAGDIPIQASRKGRPAINLARARQLGIRVDANTLLAAHVVGGFAWNAQ